MYCTLTAKTQQLRLIPGYGFRQQQIRKMPKNPEIISWSQIKKQKTISMSSHHTTHKLQTFIQIRCDRFSARDCASFITQLRGKRLKSKRCHLRRKIYIFPPLLCSCIVQHPTGEKVDIHRRVWICLFWIYKRNSLSLPDRRMTVASLRRPPLDRNM